MRVPAFLLGCLLLTAAIAAPAVVASDHGEPTLTYDVSVADDGDATWEIRAAFPLESEEERMAFEDLAASFEADDGEQYLPVDPYRLAVQELEGELDRPMQIESVERTVREGDDVGILSVRFVWTNFAVVEEERVRVGDVFNTSGQTWFGRLDANERLIIRAPANYTVEHSGLPVEDRAMVTEGPRELSAQHLQGTFLAPGATADGSLLPLLIGVAAFLGLLLVLLGLLYQYLAGDDRDVSDLIAGSGSAGETGSTALEEPPDTIGEEEDRETDLPDETLLSDEERVLALIEARDGRMKQADIVTETDWSNAKVSQLLSQMAEEGTIEKLRIGRENLIRLPEGDDGET